MSDTASQPETPAMAAMEKEHEASLNLMRANRDHIESGSEANNALGVLYRARAAMRLTFAKCACALATLAWAWSLYWAVRWAA